jgi:hypothetical protein
MASFPEAMLTMKMILSRIMKCHLCYLALAAIVLFLAGCIERRYVVYTDPPGALVLRNGVPLTASPADDHFVYYGKYHFTIIAEGYETLQVDQNIPAPWYEIPPLDFITENMIPWKLLDRREFKYRLEPRSIANTDKLLSDGQNLRNRGISLGGGSALPVPGPQNAPPSIQPAVPGSLPPPAPSVAPGSLPPPVPQLAPSPAGPASAAPGTIITPPG